MSGRYLKPCTWTGDWIWFELKDEHVCDVCSDIKTQIVIFNIDKVSNVTFRVCKGCLLSLARKVFGETDGS